MPSRNGSNGNVAPGTPLNGNLVQAQAPEEEVEEVNGNVADSANDNGAGLAPTLKLRR